MARQENQKRKILYILRILYEETDEEHILSAAEIGKRLEQYGVPSERKSIYADVEELIEFGFDIIKSRQGAYMASRQFEFPELMLLADAVQSSRFITEKKSRELITKLKKLTNRYEAAELGARIPSVGQIKTTNENIYYNMETIHNGIRQNRQIAFLYRKWSADKKLETKRDGMRYVISPWFMRMENEKYYLIGYEESSDQMKHFRIDKMIHLTILEEKRAGKEVAASISLPEYGRQTFSMFQGIPETVTLQVENELAGVMIDRFGKEVWMHPLDADHVKVQVQVMVSDHFFGWLVGLGGKARIVSPEWVLEDYRKLLQRLSV